MHKRYLKNKIFVMLLTIFMGIMNFSSFAIAEDGMEALQEEMPASLQAEQDNETPVSDDVLENDDSDAIADEIILEKPEETEESEDSLEEGSLPEEPSESVETEEPATPTEHIPEIEEPVTEDIAFNATKSDYLSYDPLYIAKYADPSLIDVSKMEMSRFVNVVTAAKGVATYNVKKQSDFKFTESNYIAGMNYEMPVYNVDDDSKYYVTIPNVNLFNDNFKAYDLMLAYNNDYAEAISGWKYKKGILYIPKSSIDNPKNKHEAPADALIAVQLNYAIGGDMDFSKSIPAQILKDKEPFDKTIRTSNIFDVDNLTIDTGVKGRRSDDISVYLNGQLIPINDEAWEYSKSNGEIRIQALPGVVSNVNVVFENRTMLKKAADVAVSFLENTTPTAFAATSMDDMVFFRTEKGKEVTLDIPSNKLFVGWRGYYDANWEHSARGGISDSQLNALKGFKNSVDYLYGGYTNQGGAMGTDEQLDVRLAPLWAISSYAAGSDLGLQDSSGQLTKNEIVRHQISMNPDVYEEHTIYEWLLKYRNKLEKSAKVTGSGNTSYPESLRNGIGGFNNFAFQFPRSVSGATGSLVSSGEDAGRENLSFKIVSDEIDESYYLAASCNHLGEAATSNGNKRSRIYVTCIGLGTDYVVLSFVKVRDGQNAAAIYKFKSYNSAFVKVKKTAASTSTNFLTEAPDIYSLAGAEYQLYINEGCTTAAKDINGAVAKLTTTKNGNTNTLEMEPGTYYVKETKASKGFFIEKNANGSPKVTKIVLTTDHTENSPFVVNSTETPIVYAAVKKSGAASNTNYLNAAPHIYSLKGAEYQLYTDEKCTTIAKDINGSNVKLTTDAYGDTECVAMEPGTYYAKEVKASKGFLIEKDANGDPKISRIVLNADYTSNNPYVIKSTEIPVVYTKLKKTAAPTEVNYLKEVPDNYTLKGAEYQLYTDEKCTTSAKDISGTNVKLTTDANGDTECVAMEPGTYYAKEVKASKGFLIDEKQIRFDLTTDYTNDTPYTIESKETPTYKEPKFLIKKYDSTGIKGWDRLINAEYKISYYALEVPYGNEDGNQDPAAVSYPAEPTRSWTFRTHKVDVPEDPSGVYAGIDWQNDKPISGNDFYMENGKRILPLGYYTIRETRSPVGLALNETVHYGKIYQKSNGIEADNFYDSKDTDLSADGVFKVYADEETQKIRLEIRKIDAETKEAKAQGDNREYSKASLAGAEYEVYYDNDETAEPELIGLMITNDKGEACLAERRMGREEAIGRTLEPGTYFVKETKASPGYVTDKYFSDGEETKEIKNGKIEVICGYDVNGKPVKKTVKGSFEDGKHLFKARIQDNEASVFSFTVTSEETPHHTLVHKKDAATGDEIPGAKLQIINSEGNIVEEWVSTEKPHDIIGLPDGDYTLREITAPYGYDVAEDAKFTVNKNVIVSHAEMKNKPLKIGTTALDAQTHSHHGTFNEEESISDTVEISGLYEGRSYKVAGKIIDKKSGLPILGKDGNEITAESEDFVASGDSASVELIFTIDSSEFAQDSSVVAFERLYRTSDVGGDEVPVEIAKHEDIDDESQSIRYGGIAGTVATDKKGKDHNLLAKKRTVLLDTVEYMNLSPEETYFISGAVFDKTSGELTDITGSVEFVPESPNGTIPVEFKFDATELEDHSLVVFEYVFNDGNLISKHDDPDNKSQTVHIGSRYNSPKTGDINYLTLYLIITVIAMSALSFMLYARSRIN